MRTQMLLFLAIFRAAPIFAQIPPEPPALFDATKPGASGYQLVFDSTFTSLATIATNKNRDPQTPGFSWYTRVFPAWGGYWSTPELAFNDGIVTITGGQMGTAAPAPNDDGYVGTTFSGGAYFEASFSFDPTNVSYNTALPINNKTNWWPSFYALPVDYLNKNDQWAGQPDNYIHFAENDFYECWQDKTRLSNRYGATIHDWWGPRGCQGRSANLGCDISNDGRTEGVPNNHEIKLPADNDWNTFHTVGNLWVAATPTHPGFIQSYFDGQLLEGGRVTWEMSGNTTAPPTGTARFSIMDQSKMVVYIGSPSNTPMRIQYVRVWQIP